MIPQEELSCTKLIGYAVIALLFIFMCYVLMFSLDMKPGQVPGW